MWRCLQIYCTKLLGCLASIGLGSFFALPSYGTNSKLCYLA
jgi:hypothetical protein